MIYTGWFLIIIGIVLVILSAYKIVEARRNDLDTVPSIYGGITEKPSTLSLIPKTKTNLFKPKGFDLESDVAHKSRIFEELKGEDQKVLYLADRGYSVTKIAKELNRGKGEIELILSLYRKES